MANTAMINLSVENCQECPFVRYQKEHASYFCTRELAPMGFNIGDGEGVPDFCPFVLQRLQGVLDVLDETTSGAIPKKYLTQIERKQRDDPDPKFGADHSFHHAQRVYEYGEKFLMDLIDFQLNSPDFIQKQKLMLKIAANLHDIGLADSARNHAVHSAELAKKYFSSGKVDIDLQDANEIVHAICNHSDGNETRNLLDAALALGDKLDVSKERIVRVTSPITAELIKVDSVEYRIVGSNREAKRAELRYVTSGGFNVQSLSEWPKSVLIPKMIAEKMLGLSFRFFVDEAEIDFKAILK